MKLVTCGLPYANGKAHIGHLRTYIPADVYVRYLRMMGEEVLFVCGSDCHGTPIVVNAEKEGVTPKELVDRYHEHFQKVFKELWIDFDFYGRTDADYNHRRTQEIVKRLIEKDYIYSKEIELAYCPECDRFLPDRYVEGICPYCGEIARGDECDQGCGRHLEPGEILQPKCKICGSEAIFRKQKHYFFKLTAFKDFLIDYLEKLKGTSNALNYAREWVKRELKDWCITRNLEWGVRFPGENLVVYVWVDAPIGYISFTEEACKMEGCEWEKIWRSGYIGDIVHFIGLDIVYHHCIFWPAILKGADYSLPKAVVASGMVKVEGKTFSKSRGYVVWVKDDYLKAGFNPDYLRYYIISHTSHEKDLNFSWKVFKEKVNNELIGTLGNFIYRVLHFTWKNFGELRMRVEDEIIERIRNVKNRIESYIRSWEFKEVCDAFMELAKFGNEYFQEKKPWELIKKDKMECERVLSNSIQLVKALVIFAYPVMPKCMMEVARTMNLNLEGLKLDSALEVDDSIRLNRPKIPFKKVEDEEIERMERILMDRIGEGSKGGGVDMIDIKEFERLDIRIGKIIKAEKIEGSKKLLKLEVDIGEEIRQVIAGIAETYNPEDLLGRLVPVLINIKPAKLMGVESRGMILAVDVNGKAVLIEPERDVPVGSKVR